MARIRNVAPRYTPARFAMGVPESRTTAAGRSVLRRIDRKHAKPKLLTFRAEYRYAMPPNVGDARNPLVFGKIPKEYQAREKQENRLALYASGLANTNISKYLTRIQSMNFRPPSNGLTVQVISRLSESASMTGQLATRKRK